MHLLPLMVYKHSSEYWYVRIFLRTVAQMHTTMEESCSGHFRF